MISFQDYIKAPGVSASRLKAVYSGGTAAHGLTMGSKTTDALATGSACHCLVMRPYDFHDRHGLGWKVPGEFVIGSEEECGKSRKNKKYNTFAKRFKGKTVILESEMADIQVYSEAARTHPRVREFLAKGSPEVAYFAEDPDFGTPVKCLADWVMGSMVVDFKFLNEANPRRFLNDMRYRWHYDLQAAWYARVFGLATGKQLTRFYFVCIEKPLALALHKMGRNPSEAVVVFECSHETMERGAGKWFEALTIWTDYQNSKDVADWGGFPQTAIELD